MRIFRISFNQTTIHLFFVLLSLGFIAPTPALAGTVSPVAYSTSTAEVIIEAYAVRYGIPAQPLINTLRCESSFNKDAIGDQGRSFGLAQIFLPAHPTITKEQALNPFFAIDFAASEFSQGRAYEWTCWRKLGGNSE